MARLLYFPARRRPRLRAAGYHLLRFQRRSGPLQHRVHRLRAETPGETPALPLAKPAAVAGLDLQVTKPAYRRATRQSSPPPAENGFTLRTLEDSGYFRENRLEAFVTSHAPSARTLGVRSASADCEVATRKAIRRIENTCRRTVWRDGRGESASVAYTPHGGRDSTRVTFAHQSTTCSYVDPYLFANDPPACPDPYLASEREFLACVKASGFANLP